MTTTSGKTDRTTFGRKPDRGSHERADFDAVVDDARVGHLAFIVDGAPHILPVAFGRDGDHIVFHASSGSHPFRMMAAGAPVAFAVTHLDGLVLARSANDSSMNYRSAVAYGVCESITDDAEKWRILDVITEHLLPGRGDSLRPMQKKEVAATIVLRLPITEFSVKSRKGGPGDEGDDIHWPVWSGVMPMSMQFGAPIPADNLDAGIELPDYLGTWKA